MTHLKPDNINQDPSKLLTEETKQMKTKRDWTAYCSLQH